MVLPLLLSTGETDPHSGWRFRHLPGVTQVAKGQMLGSCCVQMGFERSGRKEALVPFLKKALDAKGLVWVTHAAPRTSSAPQTMKHWLRERGRWGPFPDWNKEDNLRIFKPCWEISIAIPLPCFSMLSIKEEEERSPWGIWENTLGSSVRLPYSRSRLWTRLSLFLCNKPQRLSLFPFLLYSCSHPLYPLKLFSLLQSHPKRVTQWEHLTPAAPKDAYKPLFFSGFSSYEFRTSGRQWKYEWRDGYKA